MRIPLFAILVLLMNPIHAQENFIAIVTGTHFNNEEAIEKKTEKEVIPLKEKADTSSIEAIPVNTVIAKEPVAEKYVLRKGIAAWMDTITRENMYNLYALHKYAPIGTMIKLRNPMNGRIVEVKVVGKLPNDVGYKNISILISAGAARQLHALDKKFIAELMVPVNGYHR